MKNWRQSEIWQGLALVIKFFVVTTLCAVMFLPFVWMICTSFKSSQETEGAHFWPKNPPTVRLAEAAEIVGDRFEQSPSADTSDVLPSGTGRWLGGVLQKLADTRMADWRVPSNLLVVLRIIPDPFTGKYLNLHLWKWIFNSIFVAGWVTTLQVLTSSMAAYAFSRIEWSGRDKVFLLYLATMMIPGMVLSIPKYQIMVSLGLVNTYTGLVVPAAFTAFGTFMLRQFMLGIPQSYNEAAEIDGAGHLRIYLDVILPLAKPGIITLAIFTFLGNYRQLLWPLVMIKDQHLRTVPIGLLTFQGQYGSQVEMLLSATMICIVPLIVMFILLQKRLVRGINLAGGVKG